MPDALVTGATGLVGFHIARELLDKGRSVRVLVRDRERGERLAPAGCELVVGDVTEPDTIAPAVQGCEVVYHAAGLPEQWLRDKATFDRVNTGGTANVVEAVRAAGVAKLVYTSTIDVFRAGKGEAYDESVLDSEPKPTAYERSKQEADRLVARAVAEGLDAVFLHPAAVYGPGPAGSPGLNQMIGDLVARKVPALLPGGMPVVYAADVGHGHVLAAQRPAGSRYILADRYYTLKEIAEEVARQHESARVPRTVPFWAARVLSVCGELWSRVRRKPPLLPAGQLTFLRWGARPDSSRAQRELGWSPTSLSAGVSSVLDQILDAATG